MKHLTILLLGLATFTVAEVVDNVITANNAFSPDIYNELYNNPNPNYLVSPFSAFVGLSMLLSGSKGDTNIYLSHALKVSPDYENGISAVLKSMKSSNYTLQFANGMFIQKDYPVTDEYVKKASDIYQAYINRDLDFGNQKIAAKNINEWVKEKTNNSISTIINSNEITAQTKAILLNALHFRAKWDINFNSDLTTPAPFNVNSGRTIKVRTMTNLLSCMYADNKELDAKFLELPFNGEDSSIVIAFPNQIDGIKNLEPQIHKVLSPQKLTPKEMQVYLPKFKLEQEIDFKAALAKLGVTHIFDPSKADLSGIVGSPGDVHLDKFRQKVSIALNEAGIDAASAQDPHIAIKPSLLGTVARDGEFRLNHPFLYYIKIRGVIAFVGRVRDPSV